jgi:hypothetical protein
MKAIAQDPPGIARTSPLFEALDAIRYGVEGHARGSVLITA